MGEYFGPWLSHQDATPERVAHAGKLITAVNALMELAEADVAFPVNPATRSQVSGRTYGGFRPQECTIGAPHSNHKEGLAVDIFDPTGAIDEWCADNQLALEECGLWMERQDYTEGWAHFQCVPPRSGSRYFIP